MRMDALSLLSITARIADTVTNGTLMFMENAAQLSLGQTVLRFIDRCLWVVEKSVQWSLPCQEETTEENGKSFGKMTLVRPLPWIFFLPGLILLRALRAGLNVGAFILGYPKLEPCVMVKYLQKSRRRLRSIKSNGMKSIRLKKERGMAKSCEMNRNADGNSRSIQLIRSIQQTLSGLSCLDGSKLSPSPPPTKIKVRMNHESTPTPEEKSTTESASSPMYVESKRKYCQVSSDDSEEETIQAKIDRLAALDEIRDDTTFDPAQYNSASSDSSSISDESSISVTEIQEVQDEANIILCRAFAGVGGVIKEEPEPIKCGDGDERTGQKTKFDNPNTDNASENSQDNQEFHSPCKFGDEGDTAFYSPISSKSSSPDRTAPALEQVQQTWSEDNGAERGDDCRNGELKPGLKAKISGSPDKTTNGHTDEKSGTGTNAHPPKVNKSHYRGRRTSNISRKKK